MGEDNQFLLKEYELCFAQLKFYDDRSSNLLKYLFTLTASVATAQFAIYKLIQAFDHKFYIFQSFLSLIVFIAAILVFFAMLQNRLYFVYTAKQINAIRGHMLNNCTPSFVDNQLYTSTDFPALKPLSLHTIQFIGASMLCGMYASSLAFGLLNYYQKEGNLLCITTLVLVSVTVALSLIGSIYLIKTGNKSADHGIHGSNNV